ncbi:MAG: thiamine pyrophosphate-dependent enzyme [Acidobacteriota bacterium]
MGVQSGHLRRAAAPLPPASTPSIPESSVAEIAGLLKREGFVIWAGFGATKAAPLVRELVDRADARVFCSARAKGIIPEDHPNYLGVTGIGGHEAVAEYMIQERPRRTLVLGTRLGEATSFWDRDLLPSEGLVHVDLDSEVPGCAFPDFPTLPVQAEIEGFLRALLEHFPARTRRDAVSNVVPFKDIALKTKASDRGPVRPQALLDTIQRLVIDQSDAIVLSECGNSFAWTTHYLRFNEPGRYRVSTLFGSMGHTTAGVVGTALASGKKAVAVVGDGAMLMNCEISTAAQYGAEAVWIVLNDSGYGMCRDGHRALGVSDSETTFPCVDFVDWARSMGGDGARVDTEDMLDVAVAEAMGSKAPFVIDVRIDTNEASPLLKRFESLISQGGSKTVAGWAR